MRLPYFKLGLGYVHNLEFMLVYRTSQKQNWVMVIISHASYIRIQLNEPRIGYRMTTNFLPDFDRNLFWHVSRNGW